MFKAFFPGSGLFEIKPICPPLPFPWGRIIQSHSNWGFFLSAETPVENVQLPEAVFESFWIPSIIDTQLISSFECLIAFDTFSFCVGGLVAGVHGHLLDKGMYGRKVKKRIKHPREDLLRWKSVIVPYENYNFMYGKLYRVAKFLVRFVGGGCNYLGIRWITHSFLDESLGSTWISSVAFMTLLGRRYSKLTFVSVMLVSFWVGLGLTCTENLYSNFLHFLNANEITGT